MHWIDWLVVATYALIALAIGFYFTRKASEGIEDFFVAGRSLGWFVLGTSMVATTFSADTPLWVAGISRETGLFENWLWWSAAMGGMAGVFFFAHLWRRSEIVTEIEFLSLRYDPSPLNNALRIFKVIFEGILMNCILMGAVTIAVGKIISTIIPGSTDIYIGLPYLTITGTTLLVFGLGICAVIYSSLSGLYGVVYTDLIQFALAMVGSFALAFFVYARTLSDGSILASLETAPEFRPELINFFPSFEKFDMLAFTFLVYMTISWWGQSAGSGNMVQRLLSARTEQDAVKGFFWYNVCHYIIRPWPWIIVGLSSLIYLPHLNDSETAFPLMIHEFLPIGLKGIMVASLFAAYMSTIDTHLNWGSSYVVNDLYKPFVNKRASSTHYVKIARLIMLLITVVAIMIAMQLDSILQIYKYVVLVGGGVGTVLIARWYWWRVNLKAEFTAYLLSLILAPLLTLYINDGGEEDFFAIRLVVITTLVSVSWILVALFTNKKPSEHTIEFYSKMKIGGIGWQQIAAQTGIEPEKGRILIGALGCIMGCIMLYGILIGTGKLLFHQWIEGGLYLTTGLLNGFLLKKYVTNRLFQPPARDLY